jgi:CopG family nickel-responsive transcriptional regulator
MGMSEDVDRMSVTLPPDLLAAVDETVDTGEYDSRSEATRDALRAFVTEFNRQTNLDGVVSGSVVVLYDHHQSGTTDKMTALQHEFDESIVATHHVHLSHDLCIESIAVDGPGQRIEQFLTQLRPLKGIHQVKLTVLKADS